MLKEFQELATDNTSGATELIHRLLALCENCAMGYQIEALIEGIALLEKSQASMPSLHAVIQILKTEFLPNLKEGEETAEAISYILTLQQILEQSGEAISVLFTGKFTIPIRVLTMSRSSTVIATLKLLHEKNLLEHLYVLESRPMNEGLKTIRDCSALKVDATYMVDAGLMEALQNVDCAVIGADSISADGYLLNKTGSYPLAICCKEQRIPLYVLCDSLKFSPQLKKEIFVEDGPSEEVVLKGERDTFKVWNRYFEWIPIEYVREFITERGAFTPDQLSNLAGE